MTCSDSMTIQICIWPEILGKSGELKGIDREDYYVGLNGYFNEHLNWEMYDVEN